MAKQCKWRINLNLYFWLHVLTMSLFPRILCPSVLYFFFQTDVCPAQASAALRSRSQQSAAGRSRPQPSAAVRSGPRVAARCEERSTDRTVQHKH